MIGPADRVVEMGDWATSSRHGDVLTCVGVGSCIALLLIDSRRGVAGLGHVVVPDGGEPPVKYGTTAVPELVRRISEAGANIDALHAVLVGGAAMFDFSTGEPIGARNERAVRDGLIRAGIPVAAADTGGSKGRTLRATLGPEIEVRVRTSGLGETVLRLPGDPSPGRAGAASVTANFERVISCEAIG